MTTAQSLITIGIIALGTVFTRFLPFWLFPKGKPAPRIVAYLGKVLPCAVMGLLVVYCLKDVQPAAAPYGLPELIAVAENLFGRTLHDQCPPPKQEDFFGDIFHIGNNMCS